MSPKKNHPCEYGNPIPCGNESDWIVHPFKKYPFSTYYCDVHVRVGFIRGITFNIHTEEAIEDYIRRSNLEKESL